MKIRLPKRDSAVWRALVTTLEGSTVFALGLLGVPEVRDYLVQVRPEILPVFPVALATANFIRNFFRKDVRTY